MLLQNLIVFVSLCSASGNPVPLGCFQPGGITGHPVDPTPRSISECAEICRCTYDTTYAAFWGSPYYNLAHHSTEWKDVCECGDSPPKPTPRWRYMEDCGRTSVYTTVWLLESQFTLIGCSSSSLAPDEETINIDHMEDCLVHCQDFQYTYAHRGSDNQFASWCSDDTTDGQVFDCQKGNYTFTYRQDDQPECLEDSVDR
uniref:Apple domain-containing protein n=1 Tax=Kwoniella bestiolae CBS 10118 TaxID=1296100 RepID=A0A1B9FSX0_9TREE|nr:hypothetical protein I302_08629 [Kwoniella bestiolae CBS 10118]OCF21850.1 hypothetical protein I302_08629 [Kwoniella bestiolae CBS 10118]